MEEIWKKIESFENYEVSNIGNVRNKTKLMKGYCEPHGYISFKLRKESKYYKKYLHTLIANAFIPNIENKQFVDHINRDRKDNRLENLRWVSPTENNLNNLRRYNELYGIYWYEERQSYLVKLKVENRVRYLGWRKNIDDAKSLRDSGKTDIEAQYGYIFNKLD